MTALLDPDCEAGKHWNCDGTSWDNDADRSCDCPCTCHTPPEHAVATVAPELSRGGQTVDIGRGRRAEFVRWVGATAEIIVGTFTGLTPDGWKVVTDSGEVELTRDEWNWCLA